MIAQTEHIANDDAHLAAQLRRSGISPTRQRILVAREMFARPQHLSAETLLSRVNQSHPAVSRATIYNTLGAFVRAGLVRAVQLPGGGVQYDSSTHEHAHLVNEETGDVSDACVDMAALLAQVKLPAGVELLGAELVLRVREAPAS